jgi:hypothetical protein
MASQIAAFPGFGVVQNLSGTYQLSTDHTHLFNVVVDQTNHFVTVYLSTDTGATWSEADSGNHKPIAAVDPGSANCQNAASTTAGDVIYIAYVHTDLSIRIAEFNMATSTWGTVNTGGPTITSSGIGTNQVLDLERRSSGDLIVFYEGPAEIVSAVNRGRTCYVKYSGGFGAVQTIGTGQANNYNLLRVVKGGSDRIHIIMQGLSNVVRQQTLKSDDTLGTLQSISSTMNGPNVWPGVYDSISNTVTVPASSGFSAQDCGVFEATDADNPTWTYTDLTTLSTDFAPIQMFTAALDAAGAAWIFFSAFLSSGASNATGIFEFNKVGGTWQLADPSVYGVFDDSLPNNGQSTFSVSARTIAQGFALAFDEDPTNGNASNPSQMSWLLIATGGGGGTQNVDLNSSSNGVISGEAINAPVVRNPPPITTLYAVHPHAAGTPSTGGTARYLVDS